MFPNTNMSFENQSRFVLKIVGVVTVVTALAGGYYFFINSIWKPNIKIINVDFEKGFAKLQLPFGKTIDIFGDNSFFINGDWGVKFGVANSNGKTIYQNIQLIKKGLVVDILADKNKTL